MPISLRPDRGDVPPLGDAAFDALLARKLRPEEAAASLRPVVERLITLGYDLVPVTIFGKNCWRRHYGHGRGRGECHLAHQGQFRGSAAATPRLRDVVRKPLTRSSLGTTADYRDNPEYTQFPISRRSWPPQGTRRGCSTIITVGAHHFSCVW